MHQELESILSDTERNLSLIKTRLAFSPTRTKTLEGKLYPHHVGASTDQSFRAGLQSSSHLKPVQSQSTSLLIVSLQKRVDEQSKAIAHMQETIRLQSEEHACLQHAFNRLEKLFMESSTSGVLSALEQMRVDIESEVQALRRLIMQQKAHSTANMRKQSVSNLDSHYSPLFNCELDMLRKDIKYVLQRIEELDLRVSDAKDERRASIQKLNRFQRNLDSYDLLATSQFRQQHGHNTPELSEIYDAMVSCKRDPDKLSSKNQSFVNELSNANSYPSFVESQDFAKALHKAQGNENYMLAHGDSFRIIQATSDIPLNSSTNKQTMLLSDIESIESEKILSDDEFSPLLDSFSTQSVHDSLIFESDDHDLESSAISSLCEPMSKVKGSETDDVVALDLASSLDDEVVNPRHEQDDKEYTLENAKELLLSSTEREPFDVEETLFSDFC